MNEKAKKNQNDKRESSIHTVRNKALYTGFIGGILWGAFGTMLYYFNFTEVSPKSFILKSWNNASWVDSKLGTVISIILIGLLSIVIAFIYYVLCKRVYSMWMGLAYGIILWGIVFYLLHPLFTNVPRLKDLELSTIISTLCLYVLYSVFIGYTISYDYFTYKHKKT